jgi:hypothetical protein
MIREIAQFIENRTAGYFTVEVNLFVGYLPTERDDKSPVPIRCAVVLENTPAVVNGQIPDFAQKPIQIWNRAKDFYDARDDAMVIYNVLHGAAGWKLPVVGGGPAYTAMVVDAMGTPAPIRAPNDKGDFEFSSNYLFMVESP